MPSNPSAKKPRPPKKFTADYLHNWALYYLGRFASSSANIRRLMMRKARRAVDYHGGDLEDAVTLIDAEIKKLERLGLLDDRAYAEARVRSLHRRGHSSAMIKAKLREKGVAADITDNAIDALFEETPDVDLKAAVNLARRRRLGPYRQPDKREERREKDLAALARAGFSYDTARTVIETASADALEDLLEKSRDGD